MTTIHVERIVYHAECVTRRDFPVAVGKRLVTLELRPRLEGPIRVNVITPDVDRLPRLHEVGPCRIQGRRQRGTGVGIIAIRLPEYHNLPLVPPRPHRSDKTLGDAIVRMLGELLPTYEFA